MTVTIEHAVDRVRDLIKSLGSPDEHEGAFADSSGDT